MKTDPNDMAYPANEHGCDNYGTPTVSLYPGLTKREFFAAMALQGLIAHHGEGILYSKSAGVAVDLADDLIQELNKEKEG